MVSEWVDYKTHCGLLWIESWSRLKRSKQKSQSNVSEFNLNSFLSLYFKWKRFNFFNNIHWKMEYHSRNDHSGMNFSSIEHNRDFKKGIFQPF